jgi:AAHS family 4-hydroxybenzoate transporter-like MFS transporter
MSTPTRTVLLNDVIGNSKISRFQGGVILLALLISIVDGLDGQALGFAMPAISADWGLPIPRFTMIITFGLIGMITGGVIGGAIGDRFGRRPMILGSITVFAVFTLLTPLVGSLTGLFIMRLIVCLGVGGLLPNLIALASELAPSRHRIAVTTLVFSGQSVGGVIGGLIASSILPVWGWHGIYVVAGSVGVIIGVVALVALPESPQFSALRGDTARVARLLNRVVGRDGFSADDHITAASSDATKASAVALFTHRRALMTVLIWFIFGFNLLVVYFMLNFLPSLLAASGLTPAKAALVTTVYNVGGIIGILVGVLADKTHRPVLVLACAYTLGSVFILLLAPAHHSLPLLMLVVCGVGICILGAQSALSGLTTEVYPTEIRSTAAGWAMGFGRLASILGPSLGGGLLAAGLAAVSVISLTAVPGAAAAILVTALGGVLGTKHRHGAAQESNAEHKESLAA